MVELEYGVVGIKVGYRLDIEKVVVYVVFYLLKLICIICILII